MNPELRRWSWFCDTAKKSFFPLLLFSVLIWITQFWHSRTFGFYEDDYFRIPSALSMNFHQLLHFASKNIFYWGDVDGRPLHEILIYTLSNVGAKIGGLQGLYAIGFLIVCFNVFLFYFLLLRLSGSPQIALLGGIAFSLFPADTTRAFLTHSFGLQPSLGLLLLGFHLYLSGKTKLAYIPVVCTLFLYETTYLVFLVAPLLEHRYNKPKARRHALVMILVLALTVMVRRVVGEGRVAGTGVRELTLGLINIITGPITAVSMFVIRPVEACFKLNLEKVVLGLIVFVIVSIALSCHSGNRVEPEKVEVAASEDRPRIRRLFRVALLMLILSYPLTLTTIGFSVSGRGTRVHMAAALGASMVIACGGHLALGIGTLKKRQIASLAVASLCALLAVFGLTVQQDYTLAWSFQRSFWTELVTLCPDLKDGTVVLVESDGLPDNRQFLFAREKLEGVPDTRQIKFLAYPEIILQQLFQFPSSWQSPPLVYRLPLNWKMEQRSLNGMPLIDESVAEEVHRPGRAIEPSRAIFLRSSHGHLARICGSSGITPDMDDLENKCSITSSSAKKGVLYRYLIVR
jgi:hypothetical protein